MIDWDLIRTIFMVIWIGGMFIALPLLILLVKPMWVEKQTLWRLVAAWAVILLTFAWPVFFGFTLVGAVQRLRS